MAKKSFKEGMAAAFMSAPAVAAERPTEEPKGDTLFPLPGEPIRRELRSRRFQALLKPSTFDALKGRAGMLGLSANDLLNRILEREFGTEESR